MLTQPRVWLRIAVKLLALTAAVQAGVASAKHVYKYQDEDGVWHFTDKKPDTDRPVESQLVKVENSAKVTMVNVGAEGSPEYEFFNHYYGPVQVAVSFQSNDNVVSTPPLPHKFVLPGHGAHRVLSIAPRDPHRSWSYRLSYEYVPGPPRQPTSSKHAYDAPFAGGPFQVSQGWHGESTHTGLQSAYAIDITMPEGTPVLAARDGIVMEVARDFSGSGTRDYYADRANIVRILHGDGSMAVYAHLQLESTIVRPGQAILSGEQIARSGNTGYSTGPHLHFAVLHNSEMTLRSIPFSVLTSKGAKEPTTGMRLKGR